MKFVPPEPWTTAEEARGTLNYKKWFLRRYGYYKRLVREKEPVFELLGRSRPQRCIANLAW